MAKLCPKGKAAAKRKFKVYPSAYANMYASGVCSGKITPGGKKSRTKKAMGGGVDTGKKGEGRSRLLTAFMRSSPRTRGIKRDKKMGGGMIDRNMYSEGGSVARGCGAIMSDRKKKTRMV